MAVYTEVSESEASALLQRLNLGELTALRGIEGGIENTNYFVTSEACGDKREWVLTLFERLTHAQLPFYLHLMKHLAQHGVPVPDPQSKPEGARMPAGEDDLLH
ncbi:MAG: phosphotransferase, partial [Proteobacteria bacterium]|nr:phosphotransferase [Pseudomonadota bacterium]